MALLTQARENRLRALRAVAERERNIFSEPTRRGSASAHTFRTCRAI